MSMYIMDKILFSVSTNSLTVHGLHVLREGLLLTNLTLKGVVKLTDLQMRYEEWKESMYHNRNTETEQRRHNEEVERLTGEQVAEQRRANQASEALTSAAQQIQREYNLGNLDLGQQQIAETIRSHRANEFLTMTHNRYADLTQRMSVANQKWYNTRSIALQRRQSALNQWYNEQKIALDTMIASANNSNTKRQLRLQEKQLEASIDQFNRAQNLREQQFAWQKVDDTATQMREYANSILRNLDVIKDNFGPYA